MDPISYLNQVYVDCQEILSSAERGLKYFSSTTLAPLINFVRSAVNQVISVVRPVFAEIGNFFSSVQKNAHFQIQTSTHAEYLAKLHLLLGQKDADLPQLSSRQEAILLFALWKLQQNHPLDRREHKILRHLLEYRQPVSKIALSLLAPFSTRSSDLKVRIKNIVGKEDVHVPIRASLLGRLIARAKDVVEFCSDGQLPLHSLLKLSGHNADQPIENIDFASSKYFTFEPVPSGLGGTPYHAHALLSQVSIKGCSFTGCTLDWINLSKSNIEGCLFSNCSLKYTNASFAEFANCKFENCNFFGASIAFSSLTQTQLRDCSVEEVDVTEARFIDTIWPHEVEKPSQPVIGMLWRADAPGYTAYKLRRTFQEKNAKTCPIDFSITPFSKDSVRDELIEIFKKYPYEPDGTVSIMQHIIKIVHDDPAQFPSLEALSDFVKRRVSKVDAILLPGGDAHVNPLFYEADNISSHIDRLKENSIDVRRELMEAFLTSFAIEQKKPLLGICRGCQILNVYFGGTLKNVEDQELTIQELDPQNEEGITSKIAPDGLVGVSLHHQACDRINENKLRVTLKADDIVKGIESKELPFVVGLQFHPEMMSDPDGFVLGSGYILSDENESFIDQFIEQGQKKNTL